MADGGSRGDDEGGGGVQLDYPLEYDFKIIGPAGDDFAEHVRQVVERIVGMVPPERVTVRPSAQGKYLAVSVSTVLQSEIQRRAVYQALHEDERVVYYL